MTNFLKEKAESFLRDARYAISEKRWFAAAFHLEQASQLYLKHYLFLKLKDFPKTHSLERLLNLIGKSYRQEKIVKEFTSQHREVLADLEQVYLTSRYLPVEFTKEQVIKMKKFIQDLIRFLKKTCQS